MLIKTINNLRECSGNLEKLILKNGDSFLQHMPNSYGAHELNSVMFNQQGIIYFYDNYNGNVVNSCCSWNKFEEWLFECDILGGD